ncbi:MAG: VTT domain-containing protein [Chloroflexi bacterium]|nr:VTT domain-containing protein [Chloroflexota bacterium]
MGKSADRGAPTAPRKGWLSGRASARRFSPRAIAILGLLFVVAITVGVFYFYKTYPDRISDLKAYGYLGAFLISLIFNATIILPAGNFVVVATLGAILPSATIVGLVGGTGATIGEITGYMAGYSGQAIVRKQELYARVEGWVRKWGMLTIFIISIVPFLFDLAGIAAGVLRLPLWKFLIACWLGRAILYTVIAFAGARGWEALLPYLNLQ